jgi:cation diffusion facilitator family transporter
MAKESAKTVVVAVGADLAVAVAKGIVAAFSGSAAMAAECLHSLVDAANQGLLIIGQRRSSRAADDSHPFGYGAEIYFWALVVAVVIFGAGGGLTIAEGIYRFLKPEPPGNPLWNYVVLAIAFVADGSALVVAIRALRKSYPDRPIHRAIHASKDPNVFVVVLEDSAALVGVLIAFAGTFAAQVMHDGRPDAIASIGIGAVLLAVALVMMREVGSLLTGESIDPEIVAAIETVAQEQLPVAEVRRVLTMTLGPDSVIVAMDLVFHEDISVEDAATAIDRIRSEVKKRQPIVTEIFVQIDALAGKGQRAA